MKELAKHGAKIAARLPDPSCVLQVGVGGRGFVIEYPYDVPQAVLRQARELKLPLKRRRWPRVIVTAAHCLGKLPPAHAAAYGWEKTYKLLGPLFAIRKANICAECLFIDPVADIAVLGAPDNQEMHEQAEKYEALVDGALALRIGTPRTGRGWILGLGGQWDPTQITVHESMYGIGLSTGPTEGGMSGSPILNDEGHAVGVVVIGGGGDGPHPILSRDLPARFVGGARAATEKAA
jgi:hypothetical protein